MNSKWIKRLGVLLLLLLLVFQTAACQKTAGQGDTEEDGTASSYIFTMGTVFDIRVFAEDASEIMQEAEQALYGCDSLLSWREEGSLAYRFNTEHQADMSEMKEVLLVLLGWMAFLGLILLVELLSLKTLIILF